MFYYNLYYNLRLLAVSQWENSCSSVNVSILTTTYTEVYSRKTYIPQSDVTTKSVQAANTMPKNTMENELDTI